MITYLLPPMLLDVTCEIAPVPASLNGATASGVRWQAATGRLLLDVPAVARYLVEEGRRVLIDPVPDWDAAEVNRFLRMTPLAALLYQRGMLALHAAALVGSCGTVLLAGDSGAGKSALLAMLVSQGWTLLSDDLAIVDFDACGNLSVWPTFPEMILWRDTFDRTMNGIATDDLSVLDAGESRCIVRAKRFGEGPRPLHRIYWLSVHSRHSVETSEVQGADCFHAVSVLTYNSHIADALLDRTEYFRRATALARDVPIVRLRRPRGFWTLSELAERVIAQERS